MGVPHSTHSRERNTLFSLKPKRYLVSWVEDKPEQGKGSRNGHRCLKERGTMVFTCTTLTVSRIIPDNHQVSETICWLAGELWMNRCNVVPQTSLLFLGGFTSYQSPPTPSPPILILLSLKFYPLFFSEILRLDILWVGSLWTLMSHPLEISLGVLFGMGPGSGLTVALSFEKIPLTVHRVHTLFWKPPLAYSAPAHAFQNF